MPKQRIVILWAGCALAFVSIGLVAIYVMPVLAGETYLPFISQPANEPIVEAQGGSSAAARAEDKRPATFPSPPSTPSNQEELDRARATRDASLRSPAVLLRPTSTRDPSQPTPVLPARPTEDPDAVVIISPTRQSYPPAQSWSTYRDRNADFSFEYPSNWHVDAPTRQVTDFSRGYNVSVINFDPDVVLIRKGQGWLPDEVKLSVTVRPNPDQPLEAWIRSLYHPDTEFTLIEKEGPNRARWLVRGGILPNDSATIAQRAEDLVYVISYIPRDTIYVEAVEKIVDSFRATPGD